MPQKLSVLIKVIHDNRPYTQFDKATTNKLLS